MATGVQVWSQTAATNATADGNVNYAEGQAPSSLNDSSRAAMSSVAKWRDDLSGTNVTAGTSAAFTLVTNQVATALTSGFTVSFQFSKNCAPGATLAVDGLTAKPLQITPGTNVLLNEYLSGSIGSFTYSTTGTGQWIANRPPVNAPPVPGAMFPIFTTLTNTLGSNVALNSVSYADGPSVTQGTSGTWFVTGSINCLCASAGQGYQVKLWDGTTVIASAAPTATTNVIVTAPVSGIITAPVGNIKISAKMTNAPASNIVFNQSGNSADCYLTAIRVA